LKQLASTVPGLDINVLLQQITNEPSRPLQVPVPPSVNISEVQSQLAKQLENFLVPQIPNGQNVIRPHDFTSTINDFVNEILPNNQNFQQLTPQQRAQVQSVQVRNVEDEVANQDLEAQADQDEEFHEVETYADYLPAKLTIGKPHPDPVVETSSLSTVEPPDIDYNLLLPRKLIEEARLSALQLESVIYACQQHQEMMADGKTRRGFLIGDGAGVGKGRTIAGIIYENFLRGRKKSIWFSVSPDLKHDSERDLRDIGASIPVFLLSKFQYGRRIDRQSIDGHYADRGVIFSTYSGLVSKSQSVRGSLGSRLGQLISWAGPNFDGVIVFDECHRAKNITISKTAKKLSKSAEYVLEIQEKLPNARIVYASATGASETRHLGYMTRLGIWGLGTPYPTFSEFHEAIEKRGVGAMELVAVDLKMRGAYIARQLSFKTTSFEIRIAPLNDEFIDLYDKCCDMWSLALRHFTEADRYFSSDRRMLRTMWCSFWAAHQKFFKYLCISLKVPVVTQIAKEALENDKCVVIGLQSTGESKTLEALEEDKNLNEFVSTARATFESLIDNHFPAPPRPRRTPSTDSDINFSNALSSTAQPSASTSSGSSSSTIVDDNWASDNNVKFFVQDGIVKPTVKGAVSSKAPERPTRNNKKILEELVKSKKSQECVKSSRTLRAKRRASLRRPVRKSRIKKPSDDSSEAGSSILSSSPASLLDSSSNDKLNSDSDVTYVEEDDEDLTEPSDLESDDDELSVLGLKSPKKQKKNLVNDDSDSDIEILGTVAPKKRNAEIIFLSDDDEDSTEGEAIDNPMNVYRTRLCEMRDEMFATIEKIGPKLPSNTLDDLIDRLGGPDKVAEMTGRKGRIIKDADGSVTYMQRNERRPKGLDKAEIDQLDTMNMIEKDRFMKGEKLIAIISEAASSGISLQADRRVKNTRRRVHITIELPWSADRAIQQFGRTHRSNQVSGPQYVFLISELSGERRFASIVAKRLESLGALTHGDRRATTDQRDLSQFNIVSKYSRTALEYLCRYLDSNQRFADIKPVYPHGDFIKDARKAYVGVGLARDSENRFALESIAININVFLNRILGMRVLIQNAVFKLFTDIADRLIARKKIAGLFDAGILELNPESGKAVCDEPERFCLRTQAGLIKCTLRNVKVERGISWEEILQLYEERKSGDKREGFYASTNLMTRSKLVFLIIRESVDTFRIYKPNTGKQPKTDHFVTISDKAKSITSTVAEPIWRRIYEVTNTNCVHICYFNQCKRIENKMICDVGLRHRYYCILSGGILTIWPYLETKIPEATKKIQIVRLRLDDKNRVIGPVIPQSCLEKVRKILHEAEVSGIKF